jgi:cation:H+ antiporter
MTFVYLLAGLALLLVSGEFIVRGGVSLAGHFKISTLVVGITVVSFGTSAPELVVSLNAALSGHPDISLGNVVGSNISNIALVLALTVLITPYFVFTKTVFKDWLMMMAMSVMLGLMLLNGVLGTVEGIVMLVLLILFLFWTIRNSRSQVKNGNSPPPVPKYSLPVAILIVILACIGLVAGADFLVKGASEIARMLGVSERIISVSVIALGTSLPELATSAVAAAKKENEISIGNIIGSNIFNILVILGTTAVVSPLKVSDSLFVYDMLWMLGVSALIFLLILPMKGSMLSRWKGAILILIYFLYIYMTWFVIKTL